MIGPVRARAITIGAGGSSPIIPMIRTRQGSLLFFSHRSARSSIRDPGAFCGTRPELGLSTGSGSPRYVA
jgi:hypothetical protein